MAILFCHIGWMSHYKGLSGRPDKIVGGGKYVDELAHGHEACNFVECFGNKVYGHVETIKGSKDRLLNLTEIGAKADQEYIDGIDVFWTATNPESGGRYIIGWYRKARIYRQRQSFKKIPTKQHLKDEINSFRIEANFSDCVLLPIDKRNLQLQKGKDWMGQANWWFAEKKQNSEVQSFLVKAQNLLVSDIGPMIPIENLEEDSFPEGKVLFRKHLVRERNSSVIKKAKNEFFKKHGHFFCECCGFSFKARYGEIGDSYIEAHHTIPVSELNEDSSTKVKDIALLCSNCHRMIHRRRPWLSTQELKKLISDV